MALRSIMPRSFRRIIASLPPLGPQSNAPRPKNSPRSQWPRMKRPFSLLYLQSNRSFEVLLRLSEYSKHVHQDNSLVIPLSRSKFSFSCSLSLPVCLLMEAAMLVDHFLFFFFFFFFLGTLYVLVHQRRPKQYF